MRPSHRLLALLVAASLGTAAAQTNRPQPAAPKQLSRAELRACILREEELGQRHDAMREAQDAHQAASAKLSADAVELSRLLRVTDPNDEAAVDRYNQRNDARNAEVDEHNKRADALNAALAELQGADADFLATCASRPYLKADESAVLKELGIRARRYDREKPPVPARPAGRTDA